jgi:hypothetical protein
VGVRELAKLMELEYSDTGSYAGLQSGQWVTGITSGVTCASLSFSSVNYTAQAKSICSSIVSNAKINTAGNGLFYTGTSGGSYPYNKYYSIMVGLNNGSTYCYGISGVSEGPYTVTPTTPPYTIGCWGNP